MSDTVLIDDSTPRSHYINPVVNGQRMRHGLIPRPKRMYGKSGFTTFADSGIQLIPESDWAKTLDFRIQNHMTLVDIRNRGNFGQSIPSRDQNGKGYCWAHSGVSAHLLSRAKLGEPYADLSAYAIACIIKGFRDEGGNGIDGAQFQKERGCPTGQFWPQQSMSRSNDNPNTWADAAHYKYVQFVELDHSQMEAQFVSCLLQNIPVIADYNWWSHSVCAAAIKTLKQTGTIWNSWGDSWSANGMGDLEWRKFIPDDAVAVLATSLYGIDTKADPSKPHLAQAV